MTALLVLLPAIAVALVILALLIFVSGVRVSPNTRIGIVEKRFSPKGSVKSGFIALNSEAGFQPRVLRGGIHYLTPFQYVVHTAPLVTGLQGKIGYVFARDGKLLDPTQTFASSADTSDFQDVEAFLENGGQQVAHYFRKWLHTWGGTMVPSNKGNAGWHPALRYLLD